MTRRIARCLLVAATLVSFALPSPGPAAAAPSKTAAQAPAKKAAQAPAKRVAPAQTKKTAPGTKPAAKAAARGAETPDQAWARARALADDGRHAQALEVIQGALARHPDDTSLLWLEAGVTGWSGKHRESVALFEKLLARHPEMAKDVRVDLASQRLWAGDPEGALRDLDTRLEERPDDQAAERLRALALAHAERHEEAVEAYDILLLERPDDTELALGRAQALAWGGHHAQASEAYREVLKRAPDTMEARVGLAMNENWNGNHRQAAAMFEEILRDPAADPEALKGLAYAEYWSGRHDRANEPLERYRTLRPHDPEGAELATMLAREFHPGVTAGYDWSADSDDLRIFTTTVEYRLAANPRSAVAFLWRRDHVDDGGGEREPYRLGAGYERIWTDYWSSRAYLWSFKPGAGRSERGMGEVAVVFRPADRVTFDFGYEKAPVLTRLSLERDIDIRTGSVGLGWMARPRLRIEAEHAVSRYSDENKSRATSGGIEWLLLKRRRFETLLTAEAAVLRTDSDPDNGYYAPERYTEYGPGAILRWHPRESASIELRTRVGYQEERGADADPFHNLRLTLETPLGRALSLYTEFETGNSNLSSASGFEQNRWASYVSVPL